jgi:hypothetical protein
MKNFLKRKLLLTFVLAAFGLSACNLGATTPTESVSAVYTSAAQTVTAQAGQATATPFLTETPQASATASMTPSKTADSSPDIVTTPPNQTGFCDNSAYVSDVTIPDHTVIKAGETFVKTWALKNIGTCTWTSVYSMNYFSGEVMSGTATAIGQSVAPGQQVNVSVTLVAPDTVGEKIGYWRLANVQGASFGQTVSVVINVSTSTSGTVTLTPGNAGTPTKTITPAVTSAFTATPTNPAPVSTPTNTLTPLIPTLAPTTTPTVSPAATLTPAGT